MTQSTRRAAALCLAIIAGYAVAWLCQPRWWESHSIGVFPILAFFPLLALLHALMHSRPPAIRSNTPDPCCGQCGYSLRGHNLPDVRCPECGSDLGPREIIVGKDIWVSFLRKHMRRWTLLFLFLVLAAPLYVPGVHSRYKALDCGGPISSEKLRTSNAYDRIRFTLVDTRWSFLYGPAIPFTQRRSKVQFMVWGDPGNHKLDVDPADRNYSYWSADQGRVTVPGALTLAGLLNWMAAGGVITEHEDVRRELEAIWNCYEAARRDADCQVPAGLFFGHIWKTPGTWAFAGHPLWLVRLEAVGSLLLWLLVAARIRRRAMIEASLVGPHGLATGRYGHHGCTDR